jgi:hypothetical protein
MVCVPTVQTLKRRVVQLHHLAQAGFALAPLPVLLLTAAHDALSLRALRERGETPESLRRY